MPPGSRLFPAAGRTLMTRFAPIAFTSKVRAVQTQMGSRQAYQAMEADEPAVAHLTPLEMEFIGWRDSFYQATVGENGWPYVQHRGGPPGFLKALDAHTLGYADFSGNRQYISVGNLLGDDRVCLFLMDYPQQRRLKIWGRARIIDERAEPELVARLETPDYRARVERGVVISIEAYDWNCPKHITPRYTETELQAIIGELTQRAPRAESQPVGEAAIGSGPLEMVVAGMHQLTPRIRAYELRATGWGDLPPIEAGAHVMVPIRLPDGTVTTRQYSLTMHPGRRDLYEIAVLHEVAGRGGSAAIHRGWRIGTRINLDLPVNQFPLHADQRPAVLIAGGIGITPVKAMAHALKARGTSFELHYTATAPAEMAYRDALAVEFPAQCRLYFSRLPRQPRLDIERILQGAPADALFYVCGPVRLIGAVIEGASAFGIEPGRVQFESFV